MEAIEKYMKVRPDFNTDYLFVSQKGDKLSNRGIQYRIKFYLQEAGFDPKIYSTHKLRHTAATLMYKYGHVDMRALQEILGHSNVSTTQIYTHIDSEHLREAIQKNPLNHKNIDNIENQ